MKVILYILLLFSISSYLNSKENSDERSNYGLSSGIITDNIVDVDTNGMVCDFCAQSIEKVFMKRQEVKGIFVDLDNQRVIIYFKNNSTLNDKAIIELFEKSGYGVNKINRKS